MGALTVSNIILDKYFRFLKILDVKSKKRLIVKLEESIDSNSNEVFNLTSLFGAWEDNKDSDAIINQIRSSRVEKSLPQGF